MTLKVKISEIKNISFCEFDLPIEKGIYCLLVNGCKKYCAFLYCANRLLI